MSYFYGWLRSQVLDSGGRDQAIELRAATEGEAVAAFLISWKASAQGHCASYSFFVAIVETYFNFTWSYFQQLLHPFDNLIKWRTASIQQKKELEKLDI